MYRKGTFFSILQKIGKSLMMPVSVLPCAGLLVALGRMLQNLSETLSGKITNTYIYRLGRIMSTGGLAIFEQLPAIFAVGVAIGFAGGESTAGLSAIIGYFTMLNVLKVIGDLRGIELAINTGVFGGIVIGLLSAKLYKIFSEKKLHPVFGFFSGKRLVPIVTSAASIIVGIIFGYTWPPIQNQINYFGTNIMNSPLGPAFYAAGKRMLIPVGLHHVYYQPFLFEFGEFVTNTGQVLHGESARYFAGDPSAGLFMASEFPIMLFGLPAAALAMYLRTDKNKRKTVKGIMITAALTSIITGITEPIEFIFIFAAPILYVFHVLAAFLSGILTSFFDIHLGYTFSASIIDYFFGFYNQKNSVYLFIVIGPIIAVLYFIVFYWGIKLLNIEIPGTKEKDKKKSYKIPSSEKAQEVLKALGDVNNVRYIESCITRLRVSVYDSSIVQKDKLEYLSGTGILDAGGGNYQIIFGTESDDIEDEIKSIIASYNLEENDIVLKSPASGEIVDLENVPDYTYANKFLGDGIAINPDKGVIYSPVDGKIVQLFTTNHALEICSENDIEILIHIGIDTVNMNGKGFKAFAKQEDIVKAGDKLIEFDIKLIKKENKSIITPVIITNSANFKEIKLLKKGKIKVNEELLLITK